MLQVNYIRENKEQVLERLSKRENKNINTLIGQALSMDDDRRSIQKKLDDTLFESNNISKEIGNLFQQGKKEEAEKYKARTVELKEKTQVLKEELNSVEKKLLDIMYQIPNTPHDSVKRGKSPEDNEVVDEKTIEVNLPESAIPHWELADKYKLINFELGVKITGAGFPVYTGKGAKLQRALINFFLSEAENAGYSEIIPPLLINEASGIGTGQLPDKEGQMYYVKEDELYLIPTAEVPLTNLYRDVILSEKELPVKICGYTPCFRREAGSYGKDVRGLNRLHQFDKVEIIQITTPEDSYEALDNMVQHVKSLLEKLELPYRTLRLCGGDMGFTSALTYDLEVYSAAQKKWLEVSSVSNFETFQANRLMCRYKPNSGDKKTQLLHTLNGSALALPRIMAAILENNQTEEGIKIPAALLPFTGFNLIS